MNREQWVKIDVDMPIDEKLFGRPLVDRHLWTCLLCLAQRQRFETGSPILYNHTAETLANRFNLGPPKTVEEALKYFATAKPAPMIERRDDGAIVIINFAKRQGAMKEGALPAPAAARMGYVYFAQAETSGRVMIGFSRNPWARLRELRTKSSEPIEIIASAKAYPADEKRLHELFAAARANAEWFNGTPELLNYVATVATTHRLTTVATRSATSNDVGGNDVVTTRSNDVAPTSQESREVDLDHGSKKQNSTLRNGSVVAAAWDQEQLTRLRTAFGCTELTSRDFADFLTSPAALSVPSEQRKAAVEKFLVEKHAERGKGFGYLVAMIQGGAKPTSPTSLVPVAGRVLPSRAEQDAEKQREREHREQVRKEREDRKAKGLPPAPHVKSLVGSLAKSKTMSGSKS